MFEQVAPQVIPAGLDETDPDPFPLLETFRLNVCSVNCAVTEVAAVTDTMQVPVPEHPPPDQPVNVEPVAGVAVSVTDVPYVKLFEQVAPQLIPAGLDVTVPLPFPLLETESPKLSSE